MKMQRKTSEIRLSHSPLELVLGQVKFSKIDNLVSHISTLKNEFRDMRFPLQNDLVRKKVTFNLTGQVEKTEDVKQWTFRTKDGSGLVILDEAQVAFQKTQYRSFEDFTETFDAVLEKILSVTDHRRNGLVQRIGLRYANSISHRSPDRRPEYYLKKEFLGVCDEVFKENTKVLGGLTVGKTNLTNGREGTLAVRIMTTQGVRVPPDLQEFASPPSPEDQKIGRASCRERV